MLPDEVGFLLDRRPASPRSRLLRLAPPSSATLAARPAAPRQVTARPPYRLEHLLVDVFEGVEDTQLVPGRGPQFREHGRVQVGAVGHHHRRPQPPALEVLQETSHVLLVVVLNQGKGHGKVSERVGGQQQGVAAQVQFIHTQCAAEPGQHRLAVLGEVEAADVPVEAVVDEAVGQLQQEIALEGLPGAFDVEAVVEDAVEYRLADPVVVVGFGQDIGGRGAEVLAARAACLVFSVGDVQPGDLVVGDGTDAACEGALAAALRAAGGARGELGGAADRDGDLVGFGDAHGLRPGATTVGDAAVDLGRGP